MREQYDRSLRWRIAKKLEESRDKFRTKIDDAINDANSCKSDANRDAKERQG